MVLTTTGLTSWSQFIRKSLEEGADTLNSEDFFYWRMATLLRRLETFIGSAKRPKPLPLTADQRIELGRTVIDKYFKSKDPKMEIHRIMETSEAGTYQVISYPRSFIPQIDALIRDYYASLPPPKAPKIRKRIPAKKEAIFSSKMLSK